MNVTALQTHLSNALVFHANCVSDGTRKTYCVGFKAFMTFCDLYDIDHNLKIVNHKLEVPEGVDYQIAILLSFMSYGALEKQWAPDTIRVYMNGIRDQFRSQLFNLAIFNNRMIADTFAGLRNEYRCFHDEAAEKRRLPFTIQMLMFMMQHVVGRSSVQDRALIICFCLGLALLCRASELVPTPDKHFFRGKDIRFHRKSEITGVELSFLPSAAHLFQLKDVQGVSVNVRSAKNDQLGNGAKYYFPLMEVSPKVAFCLTTELFIWASFAKPLDDDPFLSYKGKWLLSYDTYLKTVKRVATVNVRSAKNDQLGNGAKYYFPLMEVSPKVAFCLTTELFIWASFAKPLDDDPFLSYKGKWFLSYDTYLKTVKRVAKACGFNPDRFGTHSIRIGGATILAAAGHPNHYIQGMGRWAGDTFMRYIRAATASMTSALISIVNPFLFTNDDLIKLSVGSKIAGG